MELVINDVCPYPPALLLLANTSADRPMKFGEGEHLLFPSGNLKAHLTDV